MKSALLMILAIAFTAPSCKFAKKILGMDEDTKAVISSGIMTGPVSVSVPTGETSFSLSGHPNGATRDQSYSVAVSGTSTHYRYKVGKSTDINCQSTDGYSEEFEVSSSINFDLSSLGNDVEVTLCVAPPDLSSPSTVSWRIDRVPPTDPSFFDSTRSGDSLSLNWPENDSDTTQFMVVYTTTLSYDFVPVDGTRYVVGEEVFTGHFVGYVGPNRQAQLENLTRNEVYLLGVYAVDSVFNYSAVNRRSLNFSVTPSASIGGENRFIFGVPGYLFVVTRNGGGIYSLADPANPELILPLEEAENFQTIRYLGDHLYISKPGEIGIYTLDNLPTSLMQVGSISWASAWHKSSNMYLHNNILAVANGTLGLSFFDVSDISKPKILSEYGDYGPVYDIIFDESKAYFIDNDELVTWDITDLSSPQLLDTQTLLAVGKSLEKSGNYIYAISNSGGINCFNASSIPLTGCTDVVITSYSGDTKVSGGYLYLSAGLNGQKIYDLADPANISLANTLTSTSFPRSSHVVANKLYVAYQDTISIYDNTTPASPSSIKSLVTSAPALAVDVQGNFAYTASGDGFWVIDVTDYKNPVLRDNYAGNFSDVIVDGNYAYVAANASGVRVLNISDPDNITLATTYACDYAWRLFKTNNHLYVSMLNSGGFEIVDTTTPTSLSQIGTLGGFTSVVKVVAKGNYAYLLEDDFLSGKGIYAIDVSNPASPATIGSRIGNHSSKDATLQGDYLYVAGHNNGLIIYDISTPNTPSEIYRGFSGINGVATRGNYLYLSLNNWGQTIVDATTPSIIVDSRFLNSIDSYAGKFYNDLYFVPTAQGLMIYDDYVGK